MIRKKIVGLLLLFVFIINLISSCITPIFAVKMTANSTSAAMMNFFSSSGQTSLEDVTKITDEELRTYAVFLSNFVELGMKSDDIFNSSTSSSQALVTTLASKFSLTGQENTIIALNDMVWKGITESKSVICDVQGKSLSGSQLLLDITNGKTIYFKNDKTGVITPTFDFKNDKYGIYRAALKIWAAQSMGFVVGEQGLASFSNFYLDCWGNIWGAYSATLSTGDTNDTIIDSSALNSYLLVMPACMNPNAFYNSSSANKQIKLPLNNVFALGNVLSTGTNNFSDTDLTKDALYPYFNLSEIKKDGVDTALKVGANSNIMIFGISSPLNYVARTNDLFQWDLAQSSGIIKSYAKMMFDYYTKTNKDPQKIVPGSAKLILSNNIERGFSSVKANQTWFKGPGLRDITDEERRAIYAYFYSPQSLDLVDSNNKPLTTSITYYTSGVAGEDGNNFFSSLGFVGYDLFSGMKTNSDGSTTNEYLLDESLVTTQLGLAMSDFYGSLSSSYGITSNNFEKDIYNKLISNPGSMWELAKKIDEFSKLFGSDAPSPALVKTNGYIDCAGENITETLKLLNTYFNEQQSLTGELSGFKQISNTNVYEIDNMNSLLNATLTLLGFSQGEVVETNNRRISVPRYLTGMEGTTPAGLTGNSGVKGVKKIPDSGSVTLFGSRDLYYFFAVDILKDTFNEKMDYGLAKQLLEMKDKTSSKSLRFLMNSAPTNNKDYPKVGHDVTDNFVYQSLNNYTLFGSKMDNSCNIQSLGAEISLPGSTTVTRSAYKSNMNINFMGIFFSYLVQIADMESGGMKDGTPSYKVTPFSSDRLPTSPSLTTGGTLSIVVSDGESGVAGSEDLTLEKMKTDLLKKINGILSEDSNEYRNTWIKSVLDGFLVSTHRAITGSWIGGMSTVSNGGTNSYASVVGYINTPSLSELSFTNWIMTNYIQIYTLLLLFIGIILIFMILLHMRTWKQGVAIFLIMSLALLMPNILIENTITIGNKVTDSIYSDRFDYWAIIQQMQSYNNLRSAENLDKSSMEYIIANNKDTAESVYSSDAGVRVKWMSPKKMSSFSLLFTNTSMTSQFSSNLTVFKWLFSSFILESEFETSDPMATYLYRPYNSIAKEGRQYYSAATTGSNKLTDLSKLDTKIDSILNYSSSSDVRNKLDFMSMDLSRNELNLLSNSDFFKKYGTTDIKGLEYSDLKLFDVFAVRPIVENTLKVTSLSDSDDATKIHNYVMDNSKLTEADTVEYWGTGSEQLNKLIFSSGSALDFTVGISLEALGDFSTDSVENTELSAFLKNTESPYYYFYNVLKSRYGNSFKNNLLADNIFNVSKTLTLSTQAGSEKGELFDLNSTNVSVRGKTKDFLDLEGLFTTVIPYLSTANNFVYEWISINGMDIPDYDFKNSTSDGIDSAAYIEAQNRQKVLFQIWAMYASWVDQLNSLDIYNQKAGIAGKTIKVENALNPSYYLAKGRPMIFSEADMIAKGYSPKDLTDIERRIQNVLEKTHEDLMYLVNYYDMDNEVLLSAAAMYATFNFNAEFSQTKLFGESVMIYPQGYEMKNFNYDAFMRLMLMNSTGESVFADKDLYVSVLGKTSFFTGVLLLIVDVMAVIVIPTMKLIILLMLLFLGLLLCVTCVVSPPDKIIKAVGNSLVFPAFMFLIANIGFALLVSVLVGEGLTQYVGSKTISVATNDPTITIGILLLLSGLYIFILFKIIKKTWKSMKEYGLNTVLGTIGIVSAGVASAVGSGVSRLGNAAVGAATAGKGNRLAGAADGFANKNALSNNLSAQRTARALGYGKKYRNGVLSDSDAEQRKKENHSDSVKKSGYEKKIDKQYDKKDKLNNVRHNAEHFINGMKPSEIIKKNKERNKKKEEYRSKKQKQFLVNDAKRAELYGTATIADRKIKSAMKKSLRDGTFEKNLDNKINRQVTDKQKEMTRDVGTLGLSRHSISDSSHVVSLKGKKKKDNTSNKKKKNRKKLNSTGKNGNNSGNNYGKPKK